MRLLKLLLAVSALLLATTALTLSATAATYNGGDDVVASDCSPPDEGIVGDEELPRRRGDRRG